MKKIIAFLLVVVVCLSLCACGGEDKELEKYQKYETLINYLEANDYASAIAEITQMQISGGSNDSTDGNDNNNQKVIEITLDNWQEYFEIKLVADVNTNDFDEFQSFSPELRLYLKEEYLERIITMDVPFEISYKDGYCCNFNYDISTGEISELEKVDYGHNVEDINRTLSFSNNDAILVTMGANNTISKTMLHGLSLSECTISDDVATLVGYMYSSIEVVRIQGTITISE